MILWAYGQERVGREMKDETEQLEYAVASGFGIAHSEKYARQRASERARGRPQKQKQFKSAAEAFAQIARDFPSNTKEH